MTEVESRIDQVTLYARGARVRRAAVIEVAEARVRLVGLPSSLIDDTVRVSAEGGAIVTAVHVGVHAPAAVVADAAFEVEPEVRAAQERVALAEAEVARLGAALAGVAQAPVALAAPPDPSGTEPPPAWHAVVAARRQLVALRTERELALREQAAAAGRALDAAHRALDAARDRAQRAGSAQRPKLHELRKHVELELEGSGRVAIWLEYQVAAARWAPSYVARLDGDRVAFELRAVVAQDSGEDWRGVALQLSTAEPERFAALPELASMRIGRRQPEPGRAGFRPPPAGADALYADYVHAFPDASDAEQTQERVPTFAEISASRESDDDDVPPELSKLREQRWDEETSRARQAPMMAMSALMSAAPAPAPGAMAPSKKRAGAPRALLDDAADGVGGGGPPRTEPVPPPPAPRLDYTNLRMAPPGSAQRGQLIPAPRDATAASLDVEVASRLSRLDHLTLPAGHRAGWPHTYDYAFATDGTVDVASDHAWHSIAVTARPSTAVLRHVAVPREQADVFRIAAIGNPLAGPLLPGPIDVYDRGNFVVTSAVEHTPPGATVEIGLGVDAQVKLSRNTEFREETAGMLRGALRLHHAIKIDVDNLTDRAIDLEIRERLPVTREGDDDVEVIAGRIDPPWERWTPDPDAPRDRRLRGGYRWRLSLAARAKRTVRAAYEVKIAGKHELVGGNRRES